jgi:hypothetical protein
MRSSMVPMNTIGGGDVSSAERFLIRLFWRIGVPLGNNEGRKLTREKKEIRGKMVRSDWSEKALGNLSHHGENRWQGRLMKKLVYRS